MDVSDNEVDWFLTAQYVVANEAHEVDFSTKLTKIKPFVSLDVILKLLLVHTPLAMCNSTMIGVIEQFSNAPTTVDSFTDVASVWDPQPVSNTMTLILGATADVKRQFYTQSLDHIQQVCFKYGWNDAEDPQLSFYKALIVKVNDLTQSFQVTDALVHSLNESSEDIRDWIQTFYMPLQAFQKYSPYSLHDYQVMLSVPEQVEMMLNEFVRSKFNSAIITKTVLPYFGYIGQDAWDAVNEWFLTLGNKIIIGTDKGNSVRQYEAVLEFVRQDALLKSLGTLQEAIMLKFCSIIILIILLNPDAVLEEIVFSKEILTLLKDLPLPPNSDFDLSSLKGKRDIEFCFSYVNPSVALVDYILKVIETGEILSANNLSFMEIIGLESSGHDTQMSELQKFLSVEASYGKSSWSITLPSIYRILKTSSIFQNLTCDELSEVILVKLLDVKLFDIIRNDFLSKYNTLSEEKTRSIVLATAWESYKSASKCDPTRGGLHNALQTLSLLNSQDAGARRLENLITANGMILNWKMYFKSGVPLTPKDLLHVENPLVVIQRILDLNDNAYKSSERLYTLLVLLIKGLDCTDKDDLFHQADKPFTDDDNMLALNIKLLALQYSSTMDMEFSHKLANDILDLAMQLENDSLTTLLNNNWIIFFTLAKFEFTDSVEDEVVDLTSLRDRMTLLSKLILFTPTDFNSQVLEYWQMLNSQYESDIELKATSLKTNHQYSENMGDLNTRLERSMNTSIDIDTSDIGRNIIGWIVGAN